jgi:hypothetical protein
VCSQYTGKSLGVLLASAAGAIRNTKSLWNDGYREGQIFVFPQKSKGSAVGLLLYPYQFAGRQNFIKNFFNAILRKVRVGIAVPVAKCELGGNMSYPILPNQQPQIVMHKHTKYGFMAAVGITGLGLYKFFKN